MPNLFGIDLPGILAATAGPGFADATLTVVTQGTRSVGAIASGTNPTSTDYPCRGLIADVSLSQVNGFLIQQGDRVITLLARTIAGGTVTPKTSDRVTISGATYNIIAVEADAAASVYHLHVRG